MRSWRPTTRPLRTAAVAAAAMLGAAVLSALYTEMGWIAIAAQLQTPQGLSSSSHSTSLGRGTNITSSNNNINDKNSSSSSRIHFKLVHGRPYRQRYHLAYMCEKRRPGAAGGNNNKVTPLSVDLQRAGVVDFECEITTSLRIAVVGDSIGMQIAARIEEALQPDKNPRSRRKRHYYRTNRVVHADSPTSTVIISNPIRGGGTLITYRINGMFDRHMQTVRRRLGLQQQHHQQQQQQRQRRRLQELFKPQPFNRTEIEIALGPIKAAAPSNATAAPHRNAVDVLVQRVNFPWVSLDMITTESLERNTLLASELFHMETMVYVNMYFSNNVVDQDSYKLFLDKREVVRNFVRTYVPPANSTLRRVLVLDMDRLVDLLNERNAHNIGLNTTHETFERWMLSQTLGKYQPDAVYRKHIAQTCGTLVPNQTNSCPRNMIFVDGLHFCPSTLAGRVAAGVACLVECAEHDQDNDDQDVGKARGPDSFLRICERACNDKYMSLDPIPMSEMAQWNGTTQG